MNTMRAALLSALLCLAAPAGAQMVDGEHVIPRGETPAYLKNIDAFDVANVASLVTAYAFIIWDCQWSASNISSFSRSAFPQVSGVPQVYYHQHEEIDPLVVAIFGRHPTTEQFFLAGSMSAAGTTIAWVLLPRKLKWVAPTLVGLAEGWVMAGNLKAVSVRVPF